MDLRTDLSPLFLDEPAARPVDVSVRAGRRRLRRRRFGQGVAALAVVGAMGTTWAVASGGSSTDSSLVATTASPSPVPTPPEPTALTRYDQPDDDGGQDGVWGFHVDRATGEVTAVAGGEVLEVVAMPAEPGELGGAAVSAALEGEVTWHYLTWNKNSISEVDDPPQPGQTLTKWAQAQQAAEPDPAPALSATPLADRFGNYTAPPGVTVVRRVDNPLDLRAPYTSVGLVLREDGKDRAYLLTPGSAVAGDSIEELVAQQRRRKGAMSTQSGPMTPLASAGPDAMPVLEAGVEVVRTIDDPLGVSAPRRSVAYVLRFEGRTWWYLWDRGPSGYLVGIATRVAGDGYPDVEAWLADQKVMAQW